MRLCQCGHAEHSYFCLTSDCKCERFEQAQCQCGDSECGGARHSAGSRCLNDATRAVDVEVPTNTADPFFSYVDERRLLCFPCARRAERVKGERLMFRAHALHEDYERPADEPTPCGGCDD